MMLLKVIGLIVLGGASIYGLIWLIAWIVHSTFWRREDLLRIEAIKEILVVFKQQPRIATMNGTITVDLTALENELKLLKMKILSKILVSIIYVPVWCYYKVADKIVNRKNKK